MSIFPAAHPALPVWSRYLSPFRVPWTAALRLRRAWARRGRWHRHRLSRPVISVGNIVLGGTGKTPTIAALAEALLARGQRPCLLTRGYGRRTRHRVVVSRGEGARVTAEVGGDEPVMLARRLPQLIVIADVRRSAAGRWAEREFSPDVFLLDDGFQHLALERDRDVVLLSGDEPFGGESLPPQGLLREPIEALADATDILVSGAISRELAARLDSLAPNARRGVLRRTTIGPLAADGSPIALETLAGTRLLAISGIARPGGFLKSLAELGIRPAATEILPDHHRYGPDEFARIGKRLDAERLDGVITTGKDAVKFTPEVGFPWWMIDVAVSGPFDPILDVIDEWAVQS